MDNTAKSLAQQILSELQHIKHALLSRQEREETDRRTDQTTEPTQVPPRSVVNTPESKVQASATCGCDPSYKKKEKRETWKFRVEIGGAIILFAYTTFAALQWRETKKTIEAMNKQMRISVRPWVGLTDEGNAVITTPITFDKNGDASIQYAVTTRNFSTAAARNVMSIATLLITE